MKQVIRILGIAFWLVLFASCNSLLRDDPGVPDDFGFRGNPEDIFLTPCDDSGDSEHIAPANLPASIRDFIGQAYPDATIIKAEGYRTGGEQAFYEVKLSNGKELYFNSDGSPVARDEHINTGDLPQAIRDYLASNYPGVGVTKAERYAFNGGSVYEVKLANRAKLYFNADGAFLARDGADDDYYHPDSWGDDHPAFAGALNLALDYIRTNFPGLESDIEKVEMEVEHGQFFLKLEFHHDRKMIFDTGGQLLCSYNGDDDDHGGTDDDDDDDD